MQVCIHTHTHTHTHTHGASLVIQMVKNPPAMSETWVWSLSWEDSLEERKATHSSILAWRTPWNRGVWWAMVNAVAKSQTQLSHFHFLSLKHTHTHTHTHTQTYTHTYIYLMPSGQGWGKYSKDTLSVPFYFIAVKIISRLLVELKVFKNIFNKEKTKCTFNFS